MGLIVTVVRVISEHFPGQDYIEFNCGHAKHYEHDEANETLVGAETECDRSHK